MKSIDTLLVNLSLANVSTTPFYVMPPGLLCLAAYLREHNFSADVLDFNVVKRKHAGYDDSKLIAVFEEDHLVKDKPSLVGASVMVAGQFKLAWEVLKSTKHRSPNTITVVGGAHVSQFPTEILKNCPEIDFVVMGEGEAQLLACSHFAQTKTFPSKWPDGIAYRHAGKIVIQPKTSYIENIDVLPYPAYDLIAFDDYLHDTSTWHNPYQIDFGVRVPIITSRGCPNLCNFCSIAKCMGLPYRPMSAKKVVDMMQKLHEQKNVHYFAIFDANFAQEPQRVIEMCHEIHRRKLKFSLDLPTGMPINATAKDMIDALASAGLIRTSISIESGDGYIRNKIMKKNFDQEKIFNVVERIRGYPQIFLLTVFVLGMPEDTGESLDASCRLIAELDTDDIALHIATPYPGTKLYQQCERDHLFFEGVDRKNLWIADWFSHANTRKFTIKPYNLDVKTLSSYRDKILATRPAKIDAYRKRMETVFRINSNYGRI